MCDTAARIACSSCRRSRVHVRAGYPCLQQAASADAKWLFRTGTTSQFEASSAVAKQFVPRMLARITILSSKPPHEPSISRSTVTRMSAITVTDSSERGCAVSLNLFFGRQNAKT
eukprot:6180559-Pleurochrysis_carterae.AAC.1